MRDNHIHSDETVKDKPSMLSFNILYEGNELGRVKLANRVLVRDLYESVRRQFPKQTKKMCVLTSRHGYECLDVALTVPEYPIYNFRSNEIF